MRELSRCKGAAKDFEGLDELRLSQCALTLHIVVLEEVFNGLAFIFSAVGALTNLFKDNIFQISNLSRFVSLVVKRFSIFAWQAPSLGNSFNKVGIFLIRQSTVLIIIVLHKVVSRDFTTLDVLGKAILELLVDVSRKLLARCHSGVFCSSEFAHEPIPGNRFATSDIKPCFFHDLQTLGAH